MQTISAQFTQTNAASSLPSSCWPECVEESFERLMANIELIAELPLAASDFVRAAAGAL